MIINKENKNKKVHGFLIRIIVKIKKINIVIIIM